MGKVSDCFKDWNYKKHAKLCCTVFSAVRYRYDVGLRRCEESFAKISPFLQPL